MLSSFHQGLHEELYILHTHTSPAASKDGIGPLTPIFLSLSPLFLFSSHPITFVSPVSTIRAAFPFFSPSDSIPASTVTHMYPHPLLHPQHSPQGAIVTQWEGSVTPASLLSATTPPSSSCFPSNHAPSAPNHPIPASPTPAGRSQLSANRIYRTLRHSRGCKAAQQQ